MAATYVEVYDKRNQQEDYQYMAKAFVSGEYVVGHIVIDKPWCSNPNAWTYYIVRNKYGGGGICGGATDLGMEKIIVDPTTIEPYTQIAKIKHHQSIDCDTILVKSVLKDSHDKNNQVAFIGKNDKIPYKLWKK